MQMFLAVQFVQSCLSLLLITKEFGRTETVSIDRQKTAFVTQFGNSEENRPVICPAEPSSMTILGSVPSIVLPVPSSSTLQSDDRPGTVSTTRSGRIQRRPLRFS
ncbi:hypothetical protein RRG08_045754 [Elysia crispata]|uniref:Secreted protein n=1 Tax=Elysia crispata TaxID=231223 RepID=A0AAE0ZAM9_9GAST|nr:hypothetical protein RRG08_045754 [Elysia crispata]